VSAKRITILTADDDPRLLRLMTRNLQLEGYEVLAVSNGQQALEHIEQKSPDLVLLDVMMPKMDGFSVCYKVRAFSTCSPLDNTQDHRGLRIRDHNLLTARAL